VIDGLNGSESLPEKVFLLTFDDDYQEHFNYDFTFLDERRIS
jgi:hypothetical protein